MLQVVHQSQSRRRRNHSQVQHRLRLEILNDHRRRGGWLRELTREAQFYSITPYSIAGGCNRIVNTYLALRVDRKVHWSRLIHRLHSSRCVGQLYYYSRLYRCSRVAVASNSLLTHVIATTNATQRKLAELARVSIGMIAGSKRELPYNSEVFRRPKHCRIFRCLCKFRHSMFPAILSMTVKKFDLSTTPVQYCQLTSRAEVMRPLL
jgi:hypothetical protein